MKNAQKHTKVHGIKIQMSDPLGVAARADPCVSAAKTNEEQRHESISGRDVIDGK